ncbi:MAG: ABC transporter substrate-binding protein [Nitriliruptorales bacterium]|nr:ABC transporter substrate-binding protein [Nitriliruptorales bacterium]
MHTLMTPVRNVAALLAVALLAAACGESTSAPGSGDAAAQGEGGTIRIGAAVALTGAVSREGNLVKDGYEFWQEQVNEQGGIEVGGEGYEVEIVFYDDESDADTGTRLTERLITQDNVQFLLGPYSSGITQATTTISERRGVLTIAPQANADDIYERGYETVFSVLPPASSYLTGILDMAVELDPEPETLAVMIRDDPFGIAAGQGAVRRAEELGMQVVFQDRYPADATDVASILTEVGRHDPDMLVASTLFQDSLLITRQLKNLQMSPALVGFTAGPALPDFIDSLSGDAHAVLGSEWWLPTLQYDGEETLGSTSEYAAAIEEEFGYTPGYHTASGSMAGLVLQLAIEQAGSLETEDIRAALLDLEPETFWGPIGWNEEGKNVVGGSNPVQIMDDEVVAVWPEEAREQEPIYPFPAWNER